MLSEREIASHGDDGLVIPKGFRLSIDEVQRLSRAVDDAVRDNPETPADHLYNLHMDAAPPFANKGNPAFTYLVRNPEILDLVGQLIGPDIILWTTQLFCKPPAVGRELPWHQDGHYWPIRPLATCTAWVAFDDTNIANGAMRYIPGSHKQGDFGHGTDRDPRRTLHQVIDDEKMDEAKAHYVELEAGQISLHDVHLVHGSAANTSGHRRAGIAIRYMPATSVFRRDLDMSVNSRLEWTDLPITLVRGENRQTENDLVVGHPARGRGNMSRVLSDEQIER